MGVDAHPQQLPVAPALISAFAPRGVLRASINMGNPILAGRDAVSGDPAGVSVDLTREIANALDRHRIEGAIVAPAA